MLLLHDILSTDILNWHISSVLWPVQQICIYEDWSSL